MCCGHYGSVCSDLSELRRERGLTQAELAEALSVSHPAISKLEAASSRGGVSSSDMLLSTLAGYIEALGGLELHATFPSDPEEDFTVPVEGTSASRDKEKAQEASPVTRCTTDDPWSP
jgi:transcriptional regulator with XRE-family HTH domain